MEDDGKKKKVTDWSGLPPELLSEIGKRLQFRLDVLRFRSVCKSWRCCVSFLTKKRNKLEPFLIPRPPVLYPVYSVDQSSFLLTERTLYALRPNQSQINCVGGCGSIGACGYGNWNTAKIAEFEEVLPNTFIPHQFSLKLNLQSFSKLRNMLHFNVSPISKFYGIVAVHNREDAQHHKGNFLGRFEFLMGSMSIVDKVVLVFNCNYVSIYCPINPSGGGDNNDDCFAVVAALLRGGKVGLLRLVGPDFTPESGGWRMINYGDDKDESFRVDDIVNLGGRLCLIDTTGRLFLVDLSSLGFTQIASPPPPISHVDGLQLLPRRKRLVEDSGVLYLLVPCRYQVCGVLRPQIKVYKLRERTRDWVEVVSLADTALFVGTDFSCAVSATSIFRNVEFNRNCIFFLRLSFPPYSRSYRDHGYKDLLFENLLNYHDLGIYDLPNGAKFKLARGGWDPELKYYLPCCLVDRSCSALRYKTMI